MSYCTVEDVKKISGTKPKNLGFKDKEEEFNQLIEEWIPQAEGLINSYCHRQWETEVPEVIKFVCAKIVSNMILFRLARGDSSVIKVNDYTHKVHSSEIFTSAEKQDLKPFRKSAKTKVFKI